MTLGDVSSVSGFARVEVMSVYFRLVSEKNDHAPQMQESLEAGREKHKSSDKQTKVRSSDRYTYVHVPVIDVSAAQRAAF